MATAQRPRGNVPIRPLRWTVEAIGREFKLAQNTVRKILHQGGSEPDASGCYSTEQVTSCLFGSLHAEKIRKERELVRKYQLENEIMEASVLDRQSLSSGFGQLADALKSVVMLDQNLTRESKEDFLRNLATWPVILEDVVQRQTRLRRNGNRQAAEEDAAIE